MSEKILDLPLDARPDPDEFVRAAMEWHFNPETGSAYWLDRAKTLDFDPRKDVKSVEDLSLFPNIVNELRDVRVEDLIPRGYGADADVVGVYESGGTTGAPKRVIILRDWWQRIMAWMNAGMDAAGFPRNVNWLVVMPSGPHMAGKMSEQHATDRGGIRFTVDMDPRWVKQLVAAGKAEEAEAYAEHLVEQAGFVLRTQDVGVIITTPPLLERISRHDDLVELIDEKVKGIVWGGAHMDADTRYLYRTEVFPGVKLRGTYGSTMILGGSNERLDLTDDDACIFDPPAPWITFRVIDPDTGRTVDHGERGQVVMNHVTKNMLLPNNLERDLATRVEPPAGLAGDSVADVTPVARFDDETVIEGVY
ncbi:acyl-CoA synthetase family protein [Actinoallomurus rhizosphaericola]|uniref:phenazine antibiotic biosynthesis protein n=1 Tax=Actinoallomurus rhizosphaericola TaxID=2952536 RepID=UPI002093A75E|nr:phenazine antibiotic biosynthesis protein [Actinoallomurus rhizosphaericola]MCO5995504.1 phenazine antibiotic biosynthesis protein [Actinoallomurus rhizosphaericola]